ncbi:UNVERIFIED_CONTAM: hypothetical protein K2H54_045862 [Gekko kuhli]
MPTLSEKLKSLERRENELKQQKKELLQQKNKRKQLESKISMKSERLRQMEQEAINLEEESEKANVKIKIINTQKVKLVTEFVQLIKTADTALQLGLTLQDEMQLLQKECSELKNKTTYLGDISRCTNLKFCGLEEQILTAPSEEKTSAGDCHN